MKVTKQHFEIFKKECERCIDRLGLSEYQFRITNEKLDGNRAEVDYNQVMLGIIYIRLNTTINDNIPNEDFKRMARHEMAHALTSELLYLTEERYISSEQVSLAAEKIANRLSTIL